MSSVSGWSKAGQTHHHTTYSLPLLLLLASVRGSPPSPRDESRARFILTVDKNKSTCAIYYHADFLSNGRGVIFTPTNSRITEVFPNKKQSLNLDSHRITELRPTQKYDYKRRWEGVRRDNRRSKATDHTHRALITAFTRRTTSTAEATVHDEVEAVYHTKE